MSDLIRSLKQAARLLIKNVDSYIKIEETLPYQAADLIEQLQQRVAELETANGKLLENERKAFDKIQTLRELNLQLTTSLNAVKREAYRAGFLSGCNYGAVNLRKTWESASEQYANKRYPDKESEK